MVCNSSSQWLLILPWTLCHCSVINLTNSTSVRLHPTPAPYTCAPETLLKPHLLHKNITLTQSSIKMKHTHNDNSSCMQSWQNKHVINERTVNSQWAQTAEIQHRLHGSEITSSVPVLHVSRLWNHHDDPPISNSFDFMASCALKAKASFISWSNVSKEKYKFM